MRSVRYFPPSIEHYDKIEIDLVLGGKIAIEFKKEFSINEIQRGIGQALLYLFFFDESWLAVPTIAIEVLKPLLEKMNLESFKVLDYENLELHEIKDGTITKHIL